jgi:hypothetical protein
MTRVFWLKAGTAAAALCVGLAGMATGAHWLVWMAVGLMSGAFLLRFAETK